MPVVPVAPVRASWADSLADSIWLRRKALTWEQRVLEGADADSDHDSDNDSDMLFDETELPGSGTEPPRMTHLVSPATAHDDLSRSDLGWAPVTDDGSPEEELPQHALRQPPLPKPGGFGTTLRCWETKEAVPASNILSREIGDVKPFFKGGGDLCGFARGDWEPMPQPMIVDSGAAETVMPAHWLIGHKIYETESSKNKEYYTTANNGRVSNEGERHLLVSSFEGDKQRNMTFQVAKVSKALGSVSQIVKKGHRVVFDQDENGWDRSYIEHKETGELMWLRERDGVYVLDILIAPPGKEPDKEDSAGFARQGR